MSDCAASTFDLACSPWSPCGCWGACSLRVELPDLLSCQQCDRSAHAPPENSFGASPPCEPDMVAREICSAAAGRRAVMRSCSLVVSSDSGESELCRCFLVDRHRLASSMRPVLSRRDSLTYLQGLITNDVKLLESAGGASEVGPEASLIASRVPTAGERCSL